MGSGNAFPNGEFRGLIGNAPRHVMDTANPPSPTGGIRELPDVEVAPHPRLTISGDVIARTSFNVASFRFEARGLLLPQVPDVGYVYLFDGLWPRVGNRTLALGSVGAKINVMPKTLLAFHVLFPLTDGGLKIKITPVVGMEYSF